MIYKILMSNNTNLIECLIISCIAAFLSSVLDMLFFSQLFGVKIEKKGRLIIWNGIAKSIAYCLLPVPYYRAVYVISTIVLFKFFSKKSWVKCFFAEVVNMVSIMLAEIFFSKTILLFNSSIEDYFMGVYDLHYMKLLQFAILVTRVLVYFIIKKKMITIDISDDLSKRNRHIINVVSIVGITVVYSVYIEISLFVDEFSYLILLLDLCSLTLYFILSIRFVMRIMTLEEQNQKIQSLEVYNKTLSIMYDSIRGFRHDYSNFVQALNGYAANNNMEGIADMTASIVKEYQNMNKLAVLNPEVINHPGIYSIVTNKCYKAFCQNISFDIDVRMDLNKLNMPIYDLCRMLGILIDNAIEAADLCEEKIINIKFFEEENVHRSVIVIENSFINSGVNIDKIFEKGYTTKEKDNGSHGLGLWTVRRILKEYENINLYTTANHLFKQQIEIYEAS